MYFSRGDCMSDLPAKRKEKVKLYVDTLQNKYNAPRNTAIDMAVAELLCGNCHKFWNENCRDEKNKVDYEKGYCVEFEERRD